MASWEPGSLGLLAHQDDHAPAGPGDADLGERADLLAHRRARCRARTTRLTGLSGIIGLDRKSVV